MIKVRSTRLEPTCIFFFDMSGFWYVLMPGLVSSVILVAEAVIIDNVSHLMSYPIHWLW